MNTKLIEGTKTKSYPYLPRISSHNRSKVITKHYVNAAVYLPQPKFALLSWLIFQSAANNTFKHSTHLLHQFSAYILAIESEYGLKKHIPTSIQLIRKDLKWLIEEGYIFPVKDATLMINPMLVYGKKVSKGDLEAAAELYQTRDIKGIINIFSKY